MMAMVHPLGTADIWIIESIKPDQGESPGGNAFCDTILLSLSLLFLMPSFRLDKATQAS